MKVLICDDQALIRDSLDMLLRLERGIEVVGRAQDGAEAVELAARLRPDLVLMDLKMPIMGGVEATRRIRAAWPEVRVLVLTTYDDDDLVLDAIRAGAAGYLLKDTPRADLMRAIRGTLEGKSFVDPTVTGRLLSMVAEPRTMPATRVTERLTARESEVLGLLARGCINADIAAQLHLSEGTVRNYVSAILAKLEVADRTQAAVLALQHGLGGGRGTPD